MYYCRTSTTIDITDITLFVAYINGYSFGYCKSVEEIMLQYYNHYYFNHYTTSCTLLHVSAFAVSRIITLLQRYKILGTHIYFIICVFFFFQDRNKFLWFGI